MEITKVLHGVVRDEGATGTGRPGVTGTVEKVEGNTATVCWVEISRLGSTNNRAKRPNAVTAFSAGNTPQGTCGHLRIYFHRSWFDKPGLSIAEGLTTSSGDSSIHSS